MVSGAVISPGRVGENAPSMRAPRRRRGVATLAMGRRESDASPTSTDAKGCAASRPASRRMVVPELPQSSGAVGARSPWRPTPCTRSVPSPSSSMATPMARSAPRVATLSSPYEKRRTSLVP